MFLSKIMLVEIGLRVWTRACMSVLHVRERERENVLAIKRGLKWLDHRLVLRLVQFLVFQVFKSLFYTSLLNDIAVITRHLSFFLYTSSTSPLLSPISPRSPSLLSICICILLVFIDECENWRCEKSRTCNWKVRKRERESVRVCVYLCARERHGYLRVAVYFVSSF